jgi:hypothetical protein
MGLIVEAPGVRILLSPQVIARGAVDVDQDAWQPNTFEVIAVLGVERLTATAYEGCRSSLLKILQGLLKVLIALDRDRNETVPLGQIKGVPDAALAALATTFLIPVFAFRQFGAVRQQEHRAARDLGKWLHDGEDRVHLL